MPFFFLKFKLFCWLCMYGRLYSVYSTFRRQPTPLLTLCTGICCTGCLSLDTHAIHHTICPKKRESHSNSKITPDKKNCKIFGSLHNLSLGLKLTGRSWQNPCNSKSPPSPPSSITGRMLEGNLSVHLP